MTNKLMISWCIFCLTVATQQKSEFEQRWQDLERGDVLAWAEHITGQDVNDLTSWDKFKSVAVIPGYKKYCGDDRLDDEVWVIVERTIDGNDYKIIEQFQSLDWGDDADYCWFVDCAPVSDVNLSTMDVYVDEELGDYPTLRTTSAQADPGLPHGTPISSFEDLEKLSLGSHPTWWVPYEGYDLTDNFYLTCNIDASETQDPTYNSNLGWVPIGSKYPSNGFRGTFDGCGYTITGLRLNGGHIYGSGLFGRITGGASIANLTIEDANIIAGDDTGILAGAINPDFLAGYEGDVLIQNCHVSGTIKDKNIATENNYGGLIGIISGSSDLAEMVYVYDCSADVDITIGTQSSVNFDDGGFVGDADYCLISNCYATGDIVCTGPYLSQSQRVGGFIGTASDGCCIEYCYATGDLVGTPGATGWGGFVGAINDSANGYIKKSYATGDVDAQGSAGGFFGGMQGTTPWIEDAYAWGNVVTDTSGGGFGGSTGAYGDVNQVYSIGTVTDAANIGGLLGATGGISFSDTYWDTETSGLATSAEGTGKETAWIKCKLNYPDSWDYDLIWYNTCAEAYTIEGSDIGNPYKGDEVCVYADGIPLGVYYLSATDPNDIVGIDEDAYDVIIAGINYYSIFESFPLNLGDYSAIRDVKIDFYESMGCHVGVGIDDSVDWIFSYDDFATSIEPLTEIKKAPFLWGTTREPVVYIWEWEPIPLQVRGIFPRVDTTKD